MKLEYQVEKIPPYVADEIIKNGILIEEIKLAVRADLSKDDTFSDVWVFLAGENLHILEGVPVLGERIKKKKKLFGIKKGPSERGFGGPPPGGGPGGPGGGLGGGPGGFGGSGGAGRKKGIDNFESEVLEYRVIAWTVKRFESYKFADFKDFVTESLPTSGMLTVMKNGELFEVAHYSNSCGIKFGKFTERINKLSNGEDISPKEEEKNKKDDTVCPKCGKPYKNPQEKICTKCINRKKVLFRLINYAGKFKFVFILTFIFIILAMLLEIIVPYLSGAVYMNQVLNPNGKYYKMVFQLVGILVALQLVNTVISIFSKRTAAFLATSVVYNIKNDVFKSMQKLSISYFSDKYTGQLMTRVDQDAESVQWFFTDGMIYILMNAFKLVGVFGLMIAMSPAVTLFVAIPIPLIFLFFKKFLPKFYKMFSKSHRAQSIMNSKMNDSFMGLRVVKAFGKEEKETKSFSESSDAFRDISAKISMTSVTIFPIINFVMWLGSLGIYIVGGLLIIKGKLLIGDITTMVAYVGMIYGPLQYLMNLVSEWSRSMNAANRIFEIIDAESEIKEIENPINIDNVKGDIKLENITFSYEPNKPIIKNVSLDVKAGEMIGIVGHSGAGKSTLINLITRLYDVDSGAIYIDGVNIKDISLKQLRDQIGIVLQDTYLFIGSVSDNIAYAKPEATTEEIINAAKAASAHDFIMGLSDGYDTFIGSGYQDLSGGERQRIALARAILKDPKILILDEATSAVDTQTECNIQQALSVLAKGRTTFNIAHRLSTLRNADRLIVLEDGAIAECGTHAEIYALEGIYYKLYQIQKNALKVRGIENECE